LSLYLIVMQCIKIKSNIEGVIKSTNHIVDSSIDIYNIHKKKNP
jgi:hypothetical protein